MKGYPYETQDSTLCKNSEMISKIETKWLPVGHFEFYICKICHVCPCVTLNTLFNITGLAIMQDL